MEHQLSHPGYHTKQGKWGSSIYSKTIQINCIGLLKLVSISHESKMRGGGKQAQWQEITKCQQNVFYMNMGSP